MYQALYRKWRPKTFSDVVGQPHITETLCRQLETGKVSHAYLFVGTRGTGKTSCAKIFAKAVNCENLQDGNPCNVCPACAGIDSGGILDVVELDAASNNGVDHVRALRDEAVFSPAAVRRRVYIVDEVHMLSTAAFNALLKILEEPPAHLLFILATTESHKIPATISSRCQRYAFRRVSANDIAGRLHTIAERESLTLEDDAARLLSLLADGSMRDALALLDQCATGQAISEPLVRDIVGIAGAERIAELLAAIHAADIDTALGILDKLYHAGRDMGGVLNELATLLRDTLLTHLAPKGAENLQSGNTSADTIRQFAALPPEWLRYALQEISDTIRGMDKTPNRKLSAELCMIRVCNPALHNNFDVLSARVAALESAAQNGTAPAVPTASVRKQAAPPAPIKKTVPVPPPPMESDLPPWDDAPFEPAPPPAREPKPVVTSEPITAQSTSEPPAASPTANATPWAQILTAASPKLDISIHTLLCDEREVGAKLEGGGLHLYIENPFIRAMVDEKTILDVLATAAAAVIGTVVTLRIHDKALPAETATSSLDELIQKGFPNVIVK